ncbi:MAG: glycoside hydrolase family 117 protein [Flavicella sp.]
MKNYKIFIIVFFLAVFLNFEKIQGQQTTAAFPAVVPLEKPNIPLSAAMHRMYDQWNPHEDRGNELYSNFKYSRLSGFEYVKSTSRRDPSKVIKIQGTYYVWYTKRSTKEHPTGPKKATDNIPSYDWDLCEIWYATSTNGFDWQEQGVAIKRPSYPNYGHRSVATPDILIWEDKYYLYYQGFNEIPGKNRTDRAAVTVAEATSPKGPWKAIGKVIVDFGKPGDWDSNAIHDPYPLIYKGKIYMYYKGAPGKGGKDGTLIRAQGVAIADHPYGPFKKSPLNPVINSGHETALFPFKDGIAAIISLDGPEKNTIQYAKDGINFEYKSMIQVPPIAPGPFVSDAFADNGNGRGITWGLMHMDAYTKEGVKYTKLARFDCDLSLDVDLPSFKKNNLRLNEETYFQKSTALPPYMKKSILKQQQNQDKNTLK